MLRRGWPASLEAPNTVIMITIRVLVDLALIETPKNWIGNQVLMRKSALLGSCNPLR